MLIFRENTMKDSKIKNMTRRIHIPRKEEMVSGIDHIIHDSRFWTITEIVLMLAFFSVLTIWAGFRGGSISDGLPGRPF